MNCTVERLQKTSDEIRHISYKEKMSLNEKVDTLLDEINKLKEALSEKTQKINSIVSKLEELTWFSGLDQECLEIAYNIILFTKDLHHTLVRFYTHFNKIREKGIAKKELKAFKLSIDDLKEINHDVETVLFNLPKDEEYQKIIKELQTL